MLVFAGQHRIAGEFARTEIAKNHLPAVGRRLRRAQAAIEHDVQGGRRIALMKDNIVLKDVPGNSGGSNLVKSRAGKIAKQLRLIENTGIRNSAVRRAEFH